MEIDSSLIKCYNEGMELQIAWGDITEFHDAAGPELLYEGFREVKEPRKWTK